MFEYKKQYYKTYNPKLYTAKTVLWFTREEIKILKSCSRCNLWMFLFTILLFIIFLILYLTTSYPFTVAEAHTIHATLGCLLILHSIVSFLGYFAILSENSCVIDIYCAMNSILIVSDVSLLVIFNHFAEGNVKKYFRSNLLLQVIIILFVIVNSILIPAAFVVELQVRAHGSVDRKRNKDSGPPLGPPLVSMRDSESPEENNDMNTTMTTMYDSPYSKMRGTGFRSQNQHSRSHSSVSQPDVIVKQPESSYKKTHHKHHSVTIHREDVLEPKKEVVKADDRPLSSSNAVSKDSVNQNQLASSQLSHSTNSVIINVPATSPESDPGRTNV